MATIGQCGRHFIAARFDLLDSTLEDAHIYRKTRVLPVMCWSSAPPRRAPRRRSTADHQPRDAARARRVNADGLLPSNQAASAANALEH
jgi:hypothetical protein